jgi:hypothetical protein
MSVRDPAAATLMPVTSRLGQKNKKTGHRPLSGTMTLCLPNMTDADQLSLPQRPHSL